MIVSHSRRYIFIKTKKTAGTSIEVFLARYANAQDTVTPVAPEDATNDHQPRNYRGTFNPFPEAFGFLGTDEKMRDEWRFVTGGGVMQPVGQALKGKRYYNHIPAYRVRSRVGNDTWDRYFTFAIERNPWDKALSQFYWKARRRPGYTFEQFVAERDVGVNYPRYCDPRTGAVMVDRIVYFHQLNAQLGEICRKVGIPWDGALPVRAKAASRTERKPYQELFQDELAPYRGEIDRLFAREIALHGWDYDSGLPTAVGGTA